MRKAFQNSILLLYKIASNSGILETRLGKATSHIAYNIYKRIFELNINHLKVFVTKDSYVLDVGANVGYYTLQFSSWTSGVGRVIAIEPELNNLMSLKNSLDKKHISNVDIIQAAAVEFDGDINLQINPDNPADHRISDSGLKVKAISIDTLMQSFRWPHVSLIKIDVQGSEYRALLGAQKILLSSYPVILMEIDDPSLEAAGTSSDILIDYLESLGYKMYSPEKISDGFHISKNTAKAMRRAIGYADFIFIHPHSRRAL